MIKIIGVLFLLFSLTHAKVSYNLSSKEIANGQVLLVKMLVEDEFLSEAYVAYNSKRYHFKPNDFSEKREYFVFIPINYYETAKQSKIVAVHVSNGEKKYKSFALKIIAGKYKSEKLSVASSKATFSKKDQERIKKEAQEAREIYATTSPESYIFEKYAYPLTSKITSLFGTKRVFNGVLKSYHSGTDFRAPVGTKIFSANSGKVVLAKKRFFAGNSVIVDHGHGIYTQYYHMSQLKVKKGDYVEKGALLGLAGSTGRSTGPHLHLGVVVNGSQVDPLQFIKTANSLFPL